MKIFQVFQVLSALEHRAESLDVMLLCQSSIRSCIVAADLIEDMLDCSFSPRCRLGLHTQPSLLIPKQSALSDSESRKLT